MELVNYVRLARKNWHLILLALLVSGTTAMVLTARTPPKYEATITMMVSGQDKEGGLATALQASALSQQRVQSYANLLTSRKLIGQIAEGADPGQLQGRIQAQVIPLTMMLRATVTDPDPVRAARLANKLGGAFTLMIRQIERLTPKSHPLVKITVVDQASVPKRPVSPRPLVNIAVAELIGLFAVFSALILRDRLDTTVKTSEALQHASKSSTLGIIGYERDARRHPLIIHKDGLSSRSEAFRSLRTNLQFIGVDRQPKSLVITSCLPGEGKSSIATNLAITLAQAGWRVILVDGDLRRPLVPSYLGIDGTVGLTDVLIDRARLQDVIQTWGEHGLAVLPSGQVPPNPSELLSSQGMRNVLGRLTELYDMVIIDAPPLLPVTDGATLAAICDGALMVARYGKTRREHISRATESLSSINARVVGAVLNFAPRRNSECYGYGYGYGYGYPAKAPKQPEVKMPANV